MIKIVYAYIIFSLSTACLFLLPVRSRYFPGGPIATQHHTDQQVEEFVTGCCASVSEK
jgi:hypothetical protein